jgi:putative endonuclease
MFAKKAVGQYGQKVAVDFLQSRGYQILGQNFYSRLGEADIIAQINGQIVFVEVKTRLSTNCGLPEDAVSEAKKEKLYNTALIYLQKNRIDHDNFRLDIIAIEIDSFQGIARIRHHKSIY